MTIFSKVSIYTYLLILLCLFHLVGNLSWIYLNNTPLSWDPSGHTLISFRFIDYLVGQNNQSFLRITDYYPPFVHLVVTFFLVLFGLHVKVAPVVITGFFIGAIVFLYLYVNQLFKNRLAALIAAATFSLLPIFYDLSRNFLLDVPLIALVLAALFFLEKSQCFTKKKYSALFALAMASALLTKWTASVFVLVPFLLKFFEGIKLKNLLMPGLIILAIITPWYAANFSDLIRNAAVNLTPEESDPKGWTVENFTFYLVSLANFQATWLGTVYFLLGSVMLAVRNKKKALVILGSIGYIYVIFTIVGNKDVRYDLLVPVLASMVIGYLLANSIQSNKLIGIFLTVALFGYYLFYYFSLSFGWPVNPEQASFRRAVDLPLVGWIDYINLDRDSSKFLAPKYENETWPQEELLTDLEKRSAGVPVNVLVLSEKERFNPENLKVVRKVLGDDNINIIAPYSMARFSDPDKLLEYMKQFSYAVIADRDYGPKGAIRYRGVLEQLRDFVRSGDPDRVHSLKYYKLPDGDGEILYEIKFY